MSLPFFWLFLNFLLLSSARKNQKVTNEADESKADVVLTITKDEDKNTETVDLKPKKKKTVDIDGYEHTKLLNKKELGQNNPLYQEPINPRIQKKFERILEDNEMNAEHKDHRLQEYVHSQQRVKTNNEDKADVDVSKDKKFTIINKFNIIPPPQAPNANFPEEAVKVQKLEIEEKFPKVEKPKHKQKAKSKVVPKSDNEDAIVKSALAEVDKVVLQILKSADKLYHELESNQNQDRSQFSQGNRGSRMDNAGAGGYAGRDGSGQNQNSQNAFYDYQHVSGANGNNGNPESAGMEGFHYEALHGPIIDYSDNNNNEHPAFPSGSDSDSSNLDEAIEEAADVISNMKNLDERVLRILQGDDLDFEDEDEHSEGSKNTDSAGKKQSKCDS